MNKRNIEAIYPLSPMQQGMLFHSLREPGSGVYYEQLTCTLRGALDEAAFQEAWQQVMQRHPVLRTSFVWRNLDRPMQVVQRQVPLPLETLDWRGLPAEEQRSRFDAQLQAERQQGFDLARAPLIQMKLVRTAEDAHYFAWSHHHALLDGWSLPILLQEVFTIYEAVHRGQADRLHLPPAQPYRSYITWLQGQDPVQAEAFWRAALAGFTTPTPLTVDMPPRRDGGSTGPMAEEMVRLPAGVTARLQGLLRQHGLTWSTLVQGAWALLLNRYSGEEDVVFGATVAGRPAELDGVERMVGLFINTIPVRTRVMPNLPTVDWLRTLQAYAAEARQFEHTPLVQIHAWSDAPRTQPLFESIIVFENYPVGATLSRQDGSLTIEDVRSFEQTNYPITLVSGPDDELPLRISYDTQRFTPPTIRRMLGHLRRLLEGMAADPGQTVASLPLLSEVELRQVLEDWSSDHGADLVDPSGQPSVEDMIAAQAQRRPDAVAVVMAETGQTLTYAELEQRSNQLAHALRERSVGPEVIVAVCLERSPEMIVALLGVLKAGGAYLPLDPTLPQQRLRYMLADAGASLVVTQQPLWDAVLHGDPAPQDEAAGSATAQPLFLDAGWSAIARQPADRPTVAVAGHHLAYIIYTSGSTGKPKGTLLHRRGLANFTRAFGETFPFSADTRCLQFASLGFDASVAEIFPTLTAGGVLVLARRETLLSVPDLTRLLQTQAINSVTLPPSLLKLLPVEDLPQLTAVGTVGEACTPDIVARWSVGRRLFNGYGPTETSVGATWHVFEDVAEPPAVVPIGRPFRNVRVYVVDERLRPVPVGVPGELLIGGVGVARGYLARPDLTAEKFVPNPFIEKTGPVWDRLYRTGDLVRWLEDGTLEYLGRIGTQVKLRGFRIELGEIEAALAAHPNVQLAAVIAREDQPGQKYLAAYLVCRSEPAPSASELRRFLSQSLPDYMLPAAFVVLPEMPRTTSDKIDRRNLPAPQGLQLGSEQAYFGPRTPVEEVLAEIWAKLLNLPRVSVEDNFFELGGHSLLATQVISRLRETFGVELPLQALFEAPTVAGLAARVESALAEAAGLAAPPITPRGHQGPAPLSFAQQRLWFLDQLEPGNLFYNIPTAVRLSGKLHVDALHKALNALVQRHPQLRTTFRAAGAEPVQVVADHVDIPMPVDDLSALPGDQGEAEALRRAQAEVRRPFRLDGSESPSLLRARLLKLAEDDHIAVLTVHHSVADGWSMSILVRELGVLYNAQVSGDELAASLPPLPIDYVDFALWQREWLSGDVLERQLAYWRAQLEGSPTLLDLPTDRPRPAMMTWRGSTEHFTLPKELSDKLTSLSRQEGATLFMTLLAAYQALLNRYSGQADINVGTPIAGRNRRQTEGIVGFFVNTLVMRARFDQATTFRDLLKQVRQTALEAYTHQDVPFEMLVAHLQPERALSHSPLFQVAFGLQNVPMEPLDLPDLSIRPLAVDSGTAKFDLTLAMGETAEGLGGTFEYNTDLFDAATIRRAIGHLQTLLTAIAEDPDQPLATLPLLTPDERQLMLWEWNDTALPTPIDRCAHQLFEARAATQPHNVAVIMAGAVAGSRPRGGARHWRSETTLTYDQLNRCANQLARHLHKLGVGPETLVGIATDRNPAMIVGILGILKAGAAYLPLDPTYPQDRLAYMIEDSQIPVLLTMDDLTAGLPPKISALTVVRLDADWPRIALEPEDNPPCPVTPYNAAYVIYTSGSTGRPKGAVLRHRGLCNLAEVQRLAFDIDATCRVLQFSPFSFDASVWETIMALGNGAALVLARQETLASGPDLLRLMASQAVTHVTLPPSVLAVLEPSALPDLRVVIAAGERCTAEIVRQWAPGRKFFDAYGPTETTVCASMGLADPADPRDPSIGRPIGNSKLFIVDQAMQPQPIGVPGELLIGGVNVGRGYLNRPELTAERFVPNPFARDDGKAANTGAAADPPTSDLLYRTGDLVRYRPDGNVEFLGRIDDQVKVRGFRIELGEIEAALRDHPAVQDAVVAVRGDTLAAYFLPVRSDDSHVPNPAELKNHLRKRLPEYMVPASFTALDAFPRSPAGKVDRRRLPAPDQAAREGTTAYVAPRTPAEETLAALCAELLRVERVGVEDNFFELGGHSLLATQLISRIREAFGVELPLRVLFEQPTVAGLAQQVAQSQAVRPAETAKVADAIQSIKNLSPEQVKALLAAKKGQAAGGAGPSGGQA